jgi:CheY-like chemotaxis protein/HPt (histidine-containing phosphotransfer) domain-containing protein
MLQVCVRDTGIGMTAEAQARLFENFSQADQSMTRRFGGTGLGLAISKRLVGLMGGNIWIERTKPDEGTTVCFTLPLRVSQAAVVRLQEVERRVGSLLQGFRVLVVDDNAAAREILADTLRAFHLDVTSAPSGAAALAVLEAATENPFDLVLMDWHMPNMNGDEAARRIRSSRVLTRQPKIVIITAYGRETVSPLAEQAGVDGLLVKPASPSTLLDTTMFVLGRGRLLAQGGEPPPLGLASLRSGTHLAGMRLLLVEDNDINREFAGELLRSEDIEVDVAVNGQEAVERVQQRDYDVVLMDIQMPVMDGLEATKRIRALARSAGGERFAKLPIIAMTALAMSQDAENSRLAGMNDHINKPVEPDRLWEILRKWAPPAQSSKAAPAADAPVRDEERDLLALASLDARRGIARIGGKPDAYRKQLRRFREHYAGVVDELQRLLVEQGLEEAERCCHSLKGVSGIIGANALHEKVGEIDDGLKRGKAPEPGELRELQARLSAVMADIDSLDHSPIQAKQGGAKIDDAELEIRLLQLVQAIEHDLGAVEPLLAGMQSGLHGSPWEPALHVIAKHIDSFELDEALVQIGQLQSQLNKKAS